MSLLRKPNILASGCALGFLAGCGTNLSNYTDYKCYTEQSYCQQSCETVGSNANRAECYNQCKDSEAKCYAVGYAGEDDPNDLQSLSGYAAEEARKKADYRIWRAQQLQEKNASGENDVEIIVLDPETGEERPADERGL